MILLRIDGEGIAPVELGYAELEAPPGQIASVSTLFHGLEVGGVRLSALLAASPPPPDGFVTVRSTDGFQTTLAAAGAPEHILVYRLGREPLPAERGGPLRLVVGGDPGASLKFVTTIRISSRRSDEVRPTCAGHSGGRAA